jgi:hypothetical protein
VTVTQYDTVTLARLAGTVLGFNYLAQTLGCIVMGHSLTTDQLDDSYDSKYSLQ